MSNGSLFEDGVLSVLAFIKTPYPTILFVVPYQH